MLSSDGSEGEFYDPESIAWSPDSKKLAAYRVRPGFPRMVTRVISSPPDQVQPKLAVQLYPKPGDAVDVDRPVIFHIDTKTAIAGAIRPVPQSVHHVAVDVAQGQPLGHL